MSQATRRFFSQPTRVTTNYRRRWQHRAEVLLTLKGMQNRRELKWLQGHHCRKLQRDPGHSLPFHTPKTFPKNSLKFEHKLFTVVMNQWIFTVLRDAAHPCSSRAACSFLHARWTTCLFALFAPCPPPVATPCDFARESAPARSAGGVEHVI